MRSRFTLAAATSNAIAIAIALSATVASTARAAEPAEARSAARKAIVEGDLPRARAILATATTEEAGAAERAAVAELGYVIETWSHVGRPPAATTANDAPIPDDQDDWEHGFARARSHLLAGHYAEAARRFDALVGTAPDLVAGARAAELRALAREAASAVAPAPPIAASAPPSTPASTPAELPPDDEGPVRMQSRWYGWQTLIVDGASIVITPAVPVLGVGGYFLGGPIVHLAHWHGLRMLASLGVRALAPTLGVLIGAEASNGCNGDFCVLSGALIGGVIGVSVAIALDAAVIARDEVPVKKKPKSVSIVPLLAPGHVGVAGTF